MTCNHKDAKGNYTYEKEDTRATTDKGEFGGIYYFCTRCDEEIQEMG